MEKDQTFYFAVTPYKSSMLHYIIVTGVDGDWETATVNARKAIAEELGDPRFVVHDYNRVEKVDSIKCNIIGRHDISDCN